MAKKAGENIMLGFFVAAGIAVLVVSLYLIGKNQSMFGDTFHVRARFRNVNGLMAGNNIRFSGIQAGTVNKITVINDTTIEVDLLLEEKMRPFVKQNSMVSIGNEGLMGNKVVNIIPSPFPGSLVGQGDLLVTAPAANTDDMMNTLSASNNNLEVISGGLVTTVARINESRVLWRILNDTTLSEGLIVSMNNLRLATANINNLAVELAAVARDVRGGKGAAGAVIADDAVARQLKESISNINTASKDAVGVLKELDSIARVAKDGISSGKGVVHAMLEDPAMVSKVNASLGNIEKGTAAFEQSMEALKHNFLTRGYFRKQEKKKARDKNP